MASSYCVLKACLVNLEELTIIYLYLFTNIAPVSIGKEGEKEEGKEGREEKRGMLLYF